MQIVRSSFSAPLRRRLIMRACSSWVPWEKFRRATSMPRRSRSRRTASELLEGPTVQTILALREAGAGEAGSGPLKTLVKSLPFRGCFRVVRDFGIDLRVELRAQQHDDVKNIEPHQQRYGRAQ